MAGYWPNPAVVAPRGQDYVPLMLEPSESQTGGPVDGFNRLIAGEMCNAAGFPAFLDNSRKRLAQLFMDLEIRFMGAEAGPYTDGASYAELGITIHPEQMTGPFVNYINRRLNVDWAVYVSIYFLASIVCS